MLHPIGAAQLLANCLDWRGRSPLSPRPLHEPVPAASSRRPWATVVRGRFEQSTRNTATASRRHGFMVPMRGLRAVAALHEPPDKDPKIWGGQRFQSPSLSAPHLWVFSLWFMVPMRGLWSVAATHEPVPAASSRRPWATVVRGRFEQSTRNTATASRRHGFWATNRGSWRTVDSLPAGAWSGSGWLGRNSSRESLPSLFSSQVSNAASRSCLPPFFAGDLGQACPRHAR